MKLIDGTEKDFILLEAEMSAGEAQEIISSTSASHIIIIRQLYGEMLYYLYTLRDARKNLSGLPDNSGTPLLIAFKLHEWDRTAATDALSDIKSAPNRSVVLLDGQLIGYFDVSQPPDVFRSFDPTGKDATQTAEKVDRTLRADFPDRVPLNETASLLVYFTREAFTGTAGTAAIQQSVGSCLDFVVQARGGFVEIIGTAEGSLAIKENEDESNILQFRLRAVKIGQADVRVLAFNQGTQVASIRLSPMIIEAGSQAGQPISYSQAVTPSPFAQPDLTLHIEDWDQNGKTGFLMYITATDPDLEINLYPNGPIFFKVDTTQFLETLYKDIEGLSLANQEDARNAAHELEGKGTDLFSQLFSNVAQQKLWKIKDRITSIIIESKDPRIPWELCRLCGDEDGRTVEGKFLCEYAVTRWIPGIPFKKTLTMKNMAFVVPGNSNLPFAADELNYLLSLKSGQRKVARISAAYGPLTAALEAGVYDAWHFTGHGAARSDDPDRAVILLENNQRLWPYRINGTLLNMGIPKPLVFLNACQTGKSGLSLVDIGGWANRFVQAGAGAFIGSYWSIYDRSAYNFMQSVYSLLLGGISIGEAVRQARQTARQSGDPTWLAYTVFGHPATKVLV